MNRYLLVTSAPGNYPLSKQHPGAPYHLCVQTGTLEGDAVLLIANPDLELQSPSDRLIGAWNSDGSPVGTIDQDLYQQIRPLGNYETGAATRQLGYHSVAGDEQRELGDTASPDPVMRLYPEGSAPFAVLVDHFYYEQEEFSGFGFLAEIAGGSQSRNPSARAMAVYSDMECTQYLWTGGAYQLGPSRLGQIDENGEPLEVWFSDTPPGQRTQSKADWHLACLFGAAQEGYATLAAESGGITLLFWENNQGASREVPDWVQPVGAHDSYQLGDHVMHNGVEWVSIHDGANSWEPGVYGWESLDGN